MKRYRVGRHVAEGMTPVPKSISIWGCEEES
jgi:hypothetical protein